MKLNTLRISFACFISLTVGCAAADVFSWKEGGRSTYSDVPRNMRPADSQIFNARTLTTSDAVKKAEEPQNPQSLADQQLELSKKLAAQNKATEENNAKIEAENRLREQAQKESACKTARLNLQNAQNARSANREQMIQTFQEQVNNYCE
ncbi:DUF4124 domain-containing protein [Stenoxybacter acetivorans]|uniref:DUF4124 domain-containing protein n=1 Tax=Stenoxybacter acetivorans TaxID=422441 RepID=UPI000564098A|nr:DUF4124 domain-containing protein [Stenoxybacter acetivorans]